MISGLEEALRLVSTPADENELKAKLKRKWFPRKAYDSLDSVLAWPEAECSHTCQHGHRLPPSVYWCLPYLPDEVHEAAYKHLYGPDSRKDRVCLFCLNSLRPTWLKIYTVIKAMLDRMPENEVDMNDCHRRYFNQTRKKRLAALLPKLIAMELRSHHSDDGGEAEKEESE